MFRASIKKIIIAPLLLSQKGMLLKLTYGKSIIMSIVTRDLYSDIV